MKGLGVTWSAQYEYGPFGEVIRSTGTSATSNPFRFSTKYQDDESELLYYGYRFYNAATGRWLSRDPIQERGGRNRSPPGEGGRGRKRYFQEAFNGRIKF